MRSLPHQPTLVDQVYEAILSEISAGKYGPDNRLIQEELAEALGVSRQPVQQALLILRSQGLLRDAPGRGLMVAPLDAEHVRNVYEIRGMIDGLASAKAAERGREAARREGPAFIERGRGAVASGSIPRMIAADMDFHFFLYGLSGNPLIQEVSAVHWSHLRRVMGEVLQHGEPPKAIWDQHEAILDAGALDRWIAKIDAAPITCFDTETTSLDPMAARLVGLSFAVTPHEAAYLPLAHRYQGAPDQLDFDATLARLRPWFEDATKPKLAQNAKYDLHVMANHGIAVQGVAHDTLLESYVVESHKPHDMDSMAMRHLGVKTISYEEVAGKGASHIGFDQVSIERATEYSAEDADITLFI